ncbi:MAG: hypothetical protein AAF544_11210 [Bacteroidota bacterium]
MRIYLALLFVSIVSWLVGQTLPLNGSKEENTIEQSWERSQRWEEIRDIDGRFVILSPGAFQESVDTIPTEVGELLFYTYFFQTPAKEADNLIYMLSYVDYPEGSLHHDSTDLVAEFFQASQEEAIAAVDGELLFSNDEILQDYPGKFWRIDYLDGEASIRTKTFVVGRRYYQVQTVSKTSRGLNDSSGKYLESLRFF